MDEYGHAHHNKKGRMNFSRDTVIWVVVIVLLIIAAGAAVYYGKKYNDSKKEVARLSDPTQVAKDQQAELIAAVGKLTILPSGQPTIATVADITKLQGQKFFVNALNGDKLLIYTTAKKAILYRPSTNKIINIAPLTIGTGSTSNSTSNSQTTNP